jgi:hypothetical protein
LFSISKILAPDNTRIAPGTIYEQNCTSKIKNILKGKCFPHTRKLVFHIKKSCKKSAMLKHTKFFKISILTWFMGFLNHIRVLNIKKISQINLFLIFLKKTIEKYKFKLNFMCFSVALFYNFFLCGKRAFLCGESNSSILNNKKYCYIQLRCFITFLSERFLDFILQKKSIKLSLK